MSDNDPTFKAIQSFVITEAAYQQAKAAYNESRKALLNLVPKEIGEHTVASNGFECTIKYPEKLAWDAEQLDALYGTDKPLFVKSSYSIDMRDLRRLPLNEQEQLAKCHEIKVGTPVIDIVKL